MGTENDLLTARNLAAMMQGKRTPNGYAQRTTADQRTAANERRGVNVSTPNTGELLVQQAQEAERLRLLILADECKTLDEFRDKLRERLNK